MQGPALPIALFHHAIVEIGNEKIMVIGGRNGPAISAQIHIYNINDNEWLLGPSMVQKREDHAAGILTDEATMEKFVLVTGGSRGGYYDEELKSTEILKQDTWSSGSNIFSSKETILKMAGVCKVYHALARICKNRKGSAKFCNGFARFNLMLKYFCDGIPS